MLSRRAPAARNLRGIGIALQFQTVQALQPRAVIIVLAPVVQHVFGDGFNDYYVVRGIVAALAVARAARDFYLNPAEPVYIYLDPGVGACRGYINPLARDRVADVSYNVSRGYAQRPVHKRGRACEMSAHALLEVAQEPDRYIRRVIQCAGVVEVILRRAAYVTRDFAYNVGVGRVERVAADNAVQIRGGRRGNVQIVVFDEVGIRSLGGGVSARPARNPAMF